MAARQHSTIALRFQPPERLFAPSRLLSTEELLALIEGRADVERTLDRMIARLDAIADDEDDTSVFGGDHD